MMATGGWPLWLEWLFGGVVLYGISHLLVLVGRWFFRLGNVPKRLVYYVIRTHNSARHVEYWLRRIRWHARLCGHDYRIVWLDEQSTDETGWIVERMAENVGIDNLESPADVERCAVAAQEVVLLDLRRHDKEAVRMRKV